VSQVLFQIGALLLRVMDARFLTRFNSVSQAVSDLRAVTACDGEQSLTRWKAV
jgi:hypothetical protein